MKKKKVFNGWTDIRDGDPTEWFYNHEINLPDICSNKKDIIDQSHIGYKVKITIEWNSHERTHR